MILPKPEPEPEPESDQSPNTIIYTLSLFMDQLVEVV